MKHYVLTVGYAFGKDDIYIDANSLNEATDQINSAIAEWERDFNGFGYFEVEWFELHEAELPWNDQYDDYDYDPEVEHCKSCRFHGCLDCPMTTDSIEWTLDCPMYEEN